ncbi:polysaccharide biosynthesis protein [Salisediminibacterium halotolerans]|uniref:polysaccharide biosynthesis protein n=1 Tax=Salisediminibacterium halotolerans TaxID=517425 RepID=UPI000EB03CE0|nr:nucleoside-diphosphate sugar epimerase/dehydratase [Salisediminibacterium halotolerans]RLJ75723.1 FlaA1/EpsC-like NDP-sugar epimerase [Actinophytocola xinjiangensis]RPE89577.1 FlaA1/EpsC-like NDP-sugar epimerase [Salisediminibacterium halotolerans]TWG36336.1 FlaA1/EpsC-like NDP-sugar epimerase [Salisediminibacterium halotolerans]GEL07216.1 UDP-N-acetylglucosamine 4,6-dehydratase [Salisediminibacterium halotolerans]
MKYQLRLSLLILVDSLIVMSSVFIASWMLTENAGMTATATLISSVTLFFAHHVFAYIFKLYKKVWSYASMQELTGIFLAVTGSVAFLALVQLITLGVTYNRALAITWMLHILLIGGSRFSWRFIRDYKMSSDRNKKRALIIGAGNGGHLVARQLINSEKSELRPVAFIDDDNNKQGLEVMGVPVLGQLEDIEHVAEHKEVEQIIIAIPSLSKQELNDIFARCAEAKVKTQIMPSVEDIMAGNVTVNEIRDVQVEDLLGREPVELDTDKIGKKLTGKAVMVTGAGGSIGSEVCRQAAAFHPAKLVLVGHGENSIYAIDMELRNQYPNMEIAPVIADVQDKAQMDDVVYKQEPDVIYHAAAHKHVPLMEKNPHEAVKNNVLGTKNVAEAAANHNVGAFVMVSTDKSVNPTSVMGATKRIAEMVVQHMDTVSATKFVAVRFGNVLGSRGSVIPLFKKQIENGGPVTVTDPEMTRYFMTIPEASRLILQAGAIAKGGETFVLDMGEPVKIVDLAKNLIRLSGFREEEIDIQYTGMRPGEKLFEELLGEDEVHDEQIYPSIYRGKTPPVNMQVIDDLAQKFEDSQKKELRNEVLDIAHFRVKQLRAVGTTE